MTQFQENAWTDERTKDGQILLYRTLPATTGGQKTRNIEKDNIEIVVIQHSYVGI